MSTSFNAPVRTGQITAWRPSTLLGYGIVAFELLSLLTRKDWRGSVEPVSHVGSVWVPTRSMEWTVRERRVRVSEGVPYAVDAGPDGLWPTALAVEVQACDGIILLELPHKRPLNIEERADAHFREAIGTPYDFGALGMLMLLCPWNWRDAKIERTLPAICSAAVSRAHEAMYGVDPVPWARERYTVPSDYLDPRTGRTVLTRALALAS